MAQSIAPRFFRHLLHEDRPLLHDPKRQTSLPEDLFLRLRPLSNKELVGMAPRNSKS